MADITGTDSGEELDGTTGDDTINGLGGDDQIFGKGGSDSVDGGAGTDTLYFAAAPGVKTTATWADDAIVLVQAGVQSVSARNIEKFVIVPDALAGQGLWVDVSQIDVRFAFSLHNAYADTIVGSSNADTFVRMSGLGPADTLTGSGGADRYEFYNDFSALRGLTILDFDADDILYIRPMAPASYVGSAALTATGQYRSYATGGKTYVVGDGGATVLTIASGEFTLQETAPGSNVLQIARTLGTAGDDLIEDSAASHFIHGLGGNDTLVGGAGADTIFGGDGDDTIYSAAATPPGSLVVFDTGTERDVLMGGAGLDELYAGYGDSVDGGAGEDILHISFMGSPTGVTVDFRQFETPGPAGNRGTIVIGGGVLTSIGAVGWIEGSDFDDKITDDYYSYQIAPIYGRGGNDWLIANTYTGPVFGGDGDDFIDMTEASFAYGAGGDAGNDTIWGSNTHGALTGGDGDDLLLGRDGLDTLSGDAGDDTLDGGFHDDALFGGDGDDSASGADGDDTIEGNAGNDILYGDQSATPLLVAGTDRAWGGSGADTIHGDGGDDMLWSGDRSGTSSGTIYDGLDDVGTEHDRLFGDAGNDTIAVGYGDHADGGGGTDTLSLSLAGAPSGVTLSTASLLGAGGSVPGVGTIVNFEVVARLRGSEYGDVLSIAPGSTVTLEGGGGNDALTGNTAADLLLGGAGDDVLTGNDGADALDGGEGADGLRGGNGGDTLSGEAGDDVAEGGAGNDLLYGGEGQDWLQGEANNDTESGDAGHDSVWGGDGDDMLDGGTGDDTIIGGAGIDTVTYAATPGVTVDLGWLENQDTRGGGWDTLFGVENVIGSWADDVLIGSAAANRLTGGMGADVLTGGGGNDVFVFQTSSDSLAPFTDLITDFSAGDRIDLSAINPSLDLAGWTFHLGATATHAGDIVLAFNAGSNRTSVSLYMNGDDIGDMVFWLSGNHLGLGVADFVL